jgi:hypothetical protein
MLIRCRGPHQDLQRTSGYTMLSKEETGGEVEPDLSEVVGRLQMLLEQELLLLVCLPGLRWWDYIMKSPLRI